MLRFFYLLLLIWCCFGPVDRTREYHLNHQANALLVTCLFAWHQLRLLWQMKYACVTIEHC